MYTIKRCKTPQTATTPQDTEKAQYLSRPRQSRHFDDYKHYSDHTVAHHKMSDQQNNIVNQLEALIHDLRECHRLLASHATGFYKKAKETLGEMLIN